MFLLFKNRLQGKTIIQFSEFPQGGTAAIVLPWRRFLNTWKHFNVLRAIKCFCFFFTYNVKIWYHAAIKEKGLLTVVPESWFVSRSARSRCQCGWLTVVCWCDLHGSPGPSTHLPTNIESFCKHQQHYAPFRKFSSSFQCGWFSLILWRGLSQTGSMFCVF